MTLAVQRIWPRHCLFDDEIIDLTKHGNVIRSNVINVSAYFSRVSSSLLSRMRQACLDRLSIRGAHYPMCVSLVERI
jgi:hypothetical protein